jgi:hypothetical protein
MSAVAHYRLTRSGRFEYRPPVLYRRSAKGRVWLGDARTHGGAVRPPVLCRRPTILNRPGFPGGPIR